MTALLLVPLLAFGVLVGVTALLVRPVPCSVRRSCIVAMALVCLSIPLSLHARAKAIRIGAALMEPSELAIGYERWVRFEWIGLCWVVHYSSSDPHKPDSSVSVDLLGHVELGSKYFVDRAMDLANQ